MTTDDKKPEKKPRKPRAPKAAAATTTDETAAAAAPPPERTVDQRRLALRRKVRMFYDLQRLRLQAAGRTLARPTKPGSEEKVEIFLHPVDLAILEGRAAELHTVERAALRDVEADLKTQSFYRNVLSDKVRYKGIGPTMAGVIMAEFDISRSDTVSRMWSFAGLLSIPSKRCKKCHNPCVINDPEIAIKVTAARDEFEGAQRAMHRARAAHEEQRLTEGEAAARELADVAEKEVARTLAALNEAEAAVPGYYHKGKVGTGCKDPLSAVEVYDSGVAQRPVKGEKLPYNAFLRTKLVGVLGPVLIKVGSPWRKVYDDYKHRLVSKGWGKNDGHRHQASIRYMIKMLLWDIYQQWRTHEGLHVRKLYAEEVLGKAPHSGAPIGTEPMPMPAAESPEEHVDHQAIEAELDVLGADAA